MMGLARCMTVVIAAGSVTTCSGSSARSSSGRRSRGRELEEGGLTVSDCAGFFDMGFNLTKLEEYDSFFMNDTVLTLPQAGVYVGV